MQDMGRIRSQVVMQPRYIKVRFNVHEWNTGRLQRFGISDNEDSFISQYKICAL